MYKNKCGELLEASQVLCLLFSAVRATSGALPCCRYVPNQAARLTGYRGGNRAGYPAV